MTFSIRCTNRLTDRSSTAESGIARRGAAERLCADRNRLHGGRILSFTVEPEPAPE